MSLFVRTGLAYLGTLLVWTGGLAFAWLLLCHVLAWVSRLGPDRALTKYRLGAAPRFTGLDERAFLRARWVSLERKRQVIVLYRLHYAVRLRRLQREETTS